MDEDWPRAGDDDAVLGGFMESGRFAMTRSVKAGAGMGVRGRIAGMLAAKVVLPALAVVAIAAFAACGSDDVQAGPTPTSPPGGGPVPTASSEPAPVPDVAVTPGPSPTAPAPNS